MQTVPWFTLRTVVYTSLKVEMIKQDKTVERQRHDAPDNVS